MLLSRVMRDTRDQQFTQFLESIEKILRSVHEQVSWQLRNFL